MVWNVYARYDVWSIPFIFRVTYKLTRHNSWSGPLSSLPDSACGVEYMQNVESLPNHLYVRSISDLIYHNTKIIENSVQPLVPLKYFTIGHAICTRCLFLVNTSLILGSSRTMDQLPAEILSRVFSHASGDDSPHPIGWDLLWGCLDYFKYGRGYGAAQNSIAAYTTVYKTWQSHFEQVTFARLWLTPERLFQDIFQADRSRVNPVGAVRRGEEGLGASDKAPK